MFCRSKCCRHEENEKLYTCVVWRAAWSKVFKYQQQSFADSGDYMEVTERKLRWHQSQMFTSSYICKERSKIFHVSMCSEEPLTPGVTALGPSKMLSHGFFPQERALHRSWGKGGIRTGRLFHPTRVVSQSAVALLVKHPPCSSNWAVGQDLGQDLKR